MGSMFGMGWWMWFPGLLLIVALLLCGAWLLARFAPERNRPLQILKERYARGEIDAEEFERRRATLEGSR